MNKSHMLLSPDSCLNKSRSDEPLFVLCARDFCAPQTIRHWATMNDGIQPAKKIKNALGIADEMERWRNEQMQPCAIQKELPT
jgi:hypothetical protein